MQYTSLGRFGLQVSRFSLGTMNFGMVADEAASFEIMDEALEAGINFFDTADVYGGPQSPDMEQGYGLSEEIIGRWLNQGNRRDRIVLATKVYQPMGTDPNVAVAEQQLLPVVRAASRNAAILADGYSCRTQLADLTEQRGQHLAELFADAIAQCSSSRSR
jgi:aryl-alcohol dehydrogenase-like predicted oxidoreductase